MHEEQPGARHPVATCAHPEHARTRYYLWPVDCDPDFLSYHCARCGGDFAVPLSGPRLPYGCWMSSAYREHVKQLFRWHQSLTAMTIGVRGEA